MRKIKRICCLAIAALVCAGTFGMTVAAKDTWPAGPSIDSECAIVMEANTGTVLYAKNEHQKCYPASITKILTTLLALENSSLDETVTFSEDSIYNTEGSGVARDIGEKLTMKDTLYAVMLESANECAYAAAEHVGGGDYSKFIDMMNQKAKELGCSDTHFTNANGLPDEKHYTSCYDMALISKAAIENEMFRKIVSTKTYTLPKTNKKDQELVMYNHHKMICNNRTSQYLYEYAIGGKTGYTNAARNTLVTYAQKDGMLLICVVMRSNPTSQYTDTEKLFDYCFENFQLYNVARSETRYTDGTENMGLRINEISPYAQIDSSAQIILPKTAEFEETQVEVNYESAGDGVAGTLVYKLGDRTVGTADVTVTDAEVVSYHFSNETDAKGIPGIVKIIVIVAVCGVVAVFLLRFFTGKKSRKNRGGYIEIKTNRRRR